MNKKCFLILIPLAFSCLAGCNNKPFDYTDTDFDGLYNSIDPNPTSNKYNAIYKDAVNDQNTNPVELVMDYRNFINDGNPSFNPQVAQIGATFIFDTYDDGRTQIQNDKYDSEKTGLFPIYNQFGMSDITYTTVGFTDNPNDKCGIYLGNHKAVIEGKKYQFFFASIHGYLESTGWFSNFDVGYDSEDCKEVFGDCPDWQDKKDHKGFSATGERVYQHVTQYISDHKDKDFETCFFGCGHSRGGGIMNLVGKKITDRNPEIKGLYYCFNTPLSTAETDKTKLESYKSIFNLICEEDLVSEVPLKKWGFDLYGNKLYFSHAKNAEYFKSIMKDEYPGAPTAITNFLKSFLFKLAPTRQAVYEFAPIDESTDIHEFDTLEEANEFINSLKAKVKDETIKKCYKTEIVAPVEDGDLYEVKVQVRPCVFIALVRQITEEISGGTFDIDVLLQLLSKYDEILSRIKSIMIEAFLEEGVGIEDILNAYPQMMRTHGGLGTVITAKFATPLSE